METGIINFLGFVCCGFVLTGWAFDTFNLGAFKVERVVITPVENRNVENTEQRSEYELLL